MKRWSAFANGLALYAAVIAGGILGSLMRWLGAVALPPTLGGLPWPTLFANVGGCFIIGFFAALTGPDGRVFAGSRTRQCPARAPAAEARSSDSGSRCSRARA